MAVVAETFADAQRGLQALEVEWDDDRRRAAQLRRAAAPSTSGCVESGERAVVARDDGDVDAVLRGRAAHGRRALRAAVSRARRRWSRTTPCAGCARTACSRCGRAPNRRNTRGCRRRGRRHRPRAASRCTSPTPADRSACTTAAPTNDPTAEAVQIARALDWKHPIKVQSLREEEFKSRPLSRDGRAPRARRRRRRRPAHRRTTSRSSPSRRR